MNKNNKPYYKTEKEEDPKVFKKDFNTYIGSSPSPETDSLMGRHRLSNPRYFIKCEKLA